MNFIKSQKKYVVYYIIVNIIAVLFLLSVFNNFPTKEKMHVKTERPYVSSLDTKINVLDDGNTIITETLKVEGVKSSEFSYTHLFSAPDEVVDIASIRLVDSNGKLTPESKTIGDKNLLTLKVEKSFEKSEPITVEYKVKGLVKHLRDGQMFQFNPWTSTSIDVKDARFAITLPQNVSESLKFYSGATLEQMSGLSTSEKTVEKTIKADDHAVNTYELRLWDQKQLISNKKATTASLMRTIADVENDVESRKRAVEQELRRQQMFCDYVRILYIVLSCIITVIFAVLLLTNFLENLNMRKYMRFEYAPESRGPATAEKLMNSQYFHQGQGIKAGLLYMALKDMIRCQGDKMNLQVVKEQDAPNDEMQEIIALQQFAFANDGTRIFQKDNQIINTSDRSANLFFAYRNTIDTEVQNYYAEEKTKKHKDFLLFHIKTEIFVVLAVILQVILFVVGRDTHYAQTFFGYTMFAIVMVVSFIFTSAMMPLLHYCAQKRKLNNAHVDEISEWENFKLFLSTPSLVRSQLKQSDNQWCEFLMYATAFGVEKSVLTAMKVATPENYAKVMTGSGKYILEATKECFVFTVK